MRYSKMTLVTFVIPLVAASIFLPSSLNLLASTEVPLAQKELSDLEKSSGGRIGVSAFDTGSKKRFQYRAEERFPFCSTFKVLVAAATLKKSMSDDDLLKQRIIYSKKDTLAEKYSPVTKSHLDDGMTIAQLCEATIQYSDSTAVNLLITKLGGPQAFQQFTRSIGDSSFRLDRMEPDLNTALPGDLRDTSTPSAMEKTLYRLVLGDVLDLPQREQLQKWMKGNTTGDTRIRAGVPQGWTVGDKTGTGDYGTTNDIGIIWPSKGAPIVVAIYFTQKEKDAAPKNDVIAAATRIVIRAFPQH